jgi:pyridoxine 4-dehydrogenase
MAAAPRGRHPLAGRCQRRAVAWCAVGLPGGFNPFPLWERLRWREIGENEVVRIGDTELTRIGLGTNRLKNNRANQALVRAAVEAGVNFIDTAHLYTRGESEQTVGAAFGASHDGVVVGTKGGFRDGHPDVLRAEFEESLERLGTDRVDLYYLHRVDADVEIETSLVAIKEYRDAGQIGEVGVSAVSVEQVQRARQVLPIAAVQNHFNLSERASEDVIDYCTEQAILFVPYFPLRGKSRPALKEIAQQHGATPTQIVLAWLLKRSPVLLPIPGTLRLEHVRENLGALEIDLSDEEYEALAH